MDAKQQVRANEIRGELVKKGLSLSKIAKACGCSRQLVWLVIRGRNGTGKTAEVKAMLSSVLNRKI